MGARGSAGARQPRRHRRRSSVRSSNERRALEADPTLSCPPRSTLADLALGAPRHRLLRPGARRAPPRRSARRCRTRPAELLLARGRLERAADEPESALAVVRAGRRRERPRRGMARLECARTSLGLGSNGGRSARTSTGAASDDSAVVAGYRADLAPIAPDSELARFDAVHGADRAAWLRAVLDRPGPRRAPRRRRAAARALPPPPVRPSSLRADRLAALLWRPGRVPLRQRGARRPRRDLRAPWRAGSTPQAVRVRPDAQRDLALWPGGRRPAVSLQRRATTTAAAATCTTIGWWRACSTCVARRARRTTSCSCRARRSRRCTAGCCIGGPTAPRTPARRERGIGRASIDYGTTTDSYELQFAQRLTAYADLVAVGAAHGVPLAQFVFAVGPAATTPSPEIDGVSYPVRVRVVALDGAEHAVAHADTTLVFRLDRALARGQYLIGRVELPVPPGRYRLARGAGARRGGRGGPAEGQRHRPLARTQLCRSAIWRSAFERRVHAGSPRRPTPSCSRRSTCSPPAARFTCTTRPRAPARAPPIVTRSACSGSAGDDRVEDRPVVSLHVDEAAGGDPIRAHRTLQLARLKPGRYVVEVKVTGPDGRVDARRRAIRVVETDH